MGLLMGLPDSLPFGHGSGAVSTCPEQTGRSLEVFFQPGLVIGISPENPKTPPPKKKEKTKTKKKWGLLAFHLVRVSDGSSPRSWIVWGLALMRSDEVGVFTFVR